MSDAPLAEQSPLMRELTTSPEDATDGAAPTGTRRALVIGCNGSAHTSLLRFAVNDAEAMATTLAAAGWTLFDSPLVGAEATTAAIEDRLTALVEVCGDQDEVLIYFAGHGAPVSLERQQRSDVYLVTSEFNPKRVQLRPESGLSLSWLRRHIQDDYQATKLLLILDCCYAGNFQGVTPSYHDFFDLFKTLIEQPPERATPRDATRAVLSATGEDAKAYERNGHGVFTSHLLDALSGDDATPFDDNGNVTLDTLIPFLRTRMPDAQKVRTFRTDTDALVLLHRPDQTRDARRRRVEQQRKAARRAELETMLAPLSALARDRLVTFVGRTRELAEIRQQIAACLARGGYVTITAPAGQGKTSVIAHLVQEYGVDTTAFHFIPLDPGPDFQVPLLRNLMARLILKHDLDETYVASDRRSVLKDYFPKVLRDIAARGEHEIIFIDGLDHLERDADGYRDLSFLPEDPPPGIVFVLGTRPDDTLKPLTLLNPLVQYRLPPLSCDDFEALLHRHEVRLEWHAIDQLYDTLEGNALFLLLATRELVANRALTPSALLRRITNDPNNLFSLAIDRLLYPRATWERVLYPTLGFLYVAGESLSRPILCSLLNAPNWEVREGLQRLGGLVIEDSVGRYSLFHAKFRDYLAQNGEREPTDTHLFADDEVMTFHRRFAAWCEGAGDGGLDHIWDDHGTPLERARRAYARAHYIMHLYGGGDDARLWEVLDVGHYGRHKIEDDPSMRTYTLDLDLGRKSTVRPGLSFREGIDRLPYLWRYTLLRCSLASRADRYPDALFKAMVLLGQETEAIGLTELLTDFEKKVQTLTSIAELLADQQQCDEGDMLVERAIQLARNSGHPRAIHTILSSLIRFQRLDDACRLAETIADDVFRQRADALCELAQALAQVNHPDADTTFARARAVAETITDGDRRVDALSKLVQALAEAHRFEEARAVVETIANNWWRASALSKLAQALAQVHRFEEARAVAETIADDWWRMDALSKLVQALVEAHRVEEARAVVETITDGQQRVDVLSKLAQALAQVNHPDAEATFARARAVVETITDGHRRVTALCKLAWALTRVNHPDANATFAHGQAVAKTIPCHQWRVTALRELVRALAQAQRFEGARSIAEVMDNYEWHLSVLRELGQMLVQTQHFEEARAVAETFTDDQQRAGALRELAQALAQVNHPDAEATFA
ncbi:MAG TPA: caspase family protein, partial [Herpetosiphonaceae bacterium]